MLALNQRFLLQPPEHWDHRRAPPGLAVPCFLRQGTLDLFSGPDQTNPFFCLTGFPKQSDFRFPIYICIYVTIVTCIKPFCVCLPCLPLGSHSFLYLPLFIHPTNLFLSACLSQAWEQLTPSLRRDEWSGERLLPQWMLGCQVTNSRGGGEAASVREEYKHTRIFMQDQGKQVGRNPMFHFALALFWFGLLIFV